MINEMNIESATAFANNFIRAEARDAFQVTSLLVQLSISFNNNKKKMEKEGRKQKLGSKGSREKQQQKPNHVLGKRYRRKTGHTQYSRTHC